MQDAYTGVLMSYIFSYAIINELCIYYNIIFLCFQVKALRSANRTLFSFILGVVFAYLPQGVLKWISIATLPSSIDYFSSSALFRSSSRPGASHRI